MTAIAARGTTNRHRDLFRASIMHVEAQEGEKREVGVRVAGRRA